MGVSPMSTTGVPPVGLPSHGRARMALRLTGRMPVLRLELVAGLIVVVYLPPAGKGDFFQPGVRGRAARQPVVVLKSVPVPRYTRFQIPRYLPGTAGHEATHLLTAERYLHLPQAPLTARVVKGHIEIATDTFARQVTLEFDGVTGAVFADNFFDMVPGRKRTIAVPKAAGGSMLTVRALNADPVRLAWKP